ncbi:MAG: 30S ribosomal protein S21 [Anaerolineae bacterium]|nr:30S ribosomal protein S21 [Anaerolineae bacterium]
MHDFANDFSEWSVVRREGESFESLLTRFRKKVTDARILSRVKKKRYFIPKSEERRKARRRAVRRHRQRQRQEERAYGTA